MSHWYDRLHAESACYGAIKWARTQPDWETAWRKCRRGA